MIDMRNFSGLLQNFNLKTQHQDISYLLPTYLLSDFGKKLLLMKVLPRGQTHLTR